MPKKSQLTKQWRASKAGLRAALRERGGRLIQIGLESDQCDTLAAVRAATGASSDAEAIVTALEIAAKKLKV